MQDFNLYKINPEDSLKNNTRLKFICPECNSEYTVLYKTVLDRIKRSSDKEYNFLCGKCQAKQTNLDNHGGVWNSQTKEYLEKVKATSLKKFGKEYYMQTQDARKKTIDTCQKKWGVNNPAQAKEVQERMKKTCIERYGTDYAMKSPKVREKLVQGMINKYGVEKAFYLDEFKEKSKITNFSHFGGMWNTQNEEWKSSYRETMLEKYGVGFPSQINIPEESLKILQSKEALQGLFENDLFLTPSLAAEKLSVCNTTILNYLHKYNLTQYIDRFPNSSIYENEIFLYIENMYKGKIIRHCRDIIAPLELDIYLPDLRLAMEFNGTFWHSSYDKDKYYHQNKTKKCLELGISLIHVYEYIWKANSNFYKELIKSFIENKPNINLDENLSYPADYGYVDFKGFKLKEISEPTCVYITDKNEIVDENLNKRKYQVYNSGMFIYEKI